MSDKSFGDHMSRGTVKNPLLSTAVTGLSIEDLTQNAVLLPVSRNQVLLGRQDQSGTQSYTLAHPNIPTPNIPSGDANFTPIHPTPPPDHTQTQYVNLQNAKNSKTFENTHKNAPPKSEDDFDVNEYFARLQGTRYVSAPLNSHLKEDSNANLEAKEENLEEINLNEPDKGSAMPEEQQSITADIAQNFSQLPTVLPQVASAVFSSFSNMLSMKSREHTPEDVKTYQQIKPEVADVGVPLMGVSEVKEVAPPPKEPPVSGQGNFRMTSKKKVYAQIPGLSSGETVQMPTYTPPTFNQQYFTPSTQTSVNFSNLETNLSKADAPQVNVDSNVFNNTVKNIPDHVRPNEFEVPNVEESKPVATSQYNAQEFNPQAPIIPPPLMFSNLAKRDSLPTTGKSVLPPSVARRISSNKPTINTQTPTFTNFGNIFVPEPVTSDIQDSYQSLPSSFLPTTSQTSIVQPNLTQPNQFLPASSSPSVFATQGPPSHSGLMEGSPTMSMAMPPINIPSSAGSSSLPTNTSSVTVQLQTNVSSPATMASCAPKNLPPPPTHAALKSSNAASKQSPISPQPWTISSESQFVPPTTIFTPGKELTQKSSALESANIPSFASANVAMVPMIPASTLTPMFNPCLQDQISSGLVTEPSISEMTSPESQPTGNFSILDPKYKGLSTVLNAPPADSKLPEPPKASGNTNFRMTKKRPQYYSGPIEGIGAISNNIKPTIAPVANAAFQSALFTPETTTGYQGAMFTPEPVADDAIKDTSPAYHGAIITPESVVQKQSIDSSSNVLQSALFTAPDPNLTAPSAEYAFDITKQPEAVPYAPFDINKAPNPSTLNPVYNTAFDMSRDITDNYEPAKESTFGIIGSLKSKLGSLDINRIQNSVTTFFDPGYNKPEASKENEANEYAQSQGGLEIFVPNVETTHAQPYNYDAYNASFTYGHSGVPNPTDYYQQQVHNVYSHESYYTQPDYGIQSYSQEYNVQQNYNQTPNVASFEPTVSATGFTPPYENKITATTLTGWQDTVGNVKDENSFLVSKEYEKPEAVIPDIPVDSSKANINSVLTHSEVRTREQEKIEQSMEKLQIKDESESNLKLIDLTKDVAKNQEQQLSQKSDLTSSIRENDDYNLKEAFGGVPENEKLVNYYDSFGNADSKAEESGRRKEIEITSLFSTPLYDLSSLIASKSQEMSDEVSEIREKVSSNSDEEEVDYQAISANLLALDAAENPFKDEKRRSSDLNICETCREVSKPDGKEADLTSQLIDNITAPIQLLNPVEVPFTESCSNIPDDFDTINQCAEISLIADETVETLQVQSATELLDDKESTNIDINYGWRNEAAFPPGQDLLDRDFTFKPNPNAIGFFGDNNLFFDNIPTNASDEIKAEFKVSQDETPIVLQREMSIPTAPPLEDSDDAKSDETGILDVLSIEQDASKDFPVFEEFVIEPSETDDDKIEIRDKSDEVKDTFTNRVDRFKKLESSEDSTQHKDFNFGHSSGIMPSYFDTGNYAVETHYRNSLTSPTFTKKSSESNVSFRIPPGFEEQYRPKSQENNKNVEPKIPDTFTQTPTTTTSTFSTVHTNTATTTVQASKLAVAQDMKPETKLPDFASVFGAKIVTDDTPAASFGAQNADDNIPDNSAINPKEDIIKEKVVDKKTEPLPDPLNFFASAAPETNAPESVNRLASYFAAPPKTDNTKSFFELSLGQDHYRQKETNVKECDDKSGCPKPFFELSQSQDHYKKDLPNITHDKYIDNLNLMKDLTSYQNIEPNTDQVVRTVNHFTVEYDDATLNYNKGEPSAKDFNKKTDVNKNKDKSEIKETPLDDIGTLEGIVNTCKYCCELNNGPILTMRETVDNLGKAGYRQAMDCGSDKPKDEINMNPEKEGERSVSVKMDDISDGDNKEGVAMMHENRSSTEYEPVKHHWFYRVDLEGKSTWRGFSINDSKAIETAFQSPDLNEGTLVATDGGRFDVNVMGRLRIAVYWTDKPTNVRRCSWFYKGTTDARYVPYTEPVAEKLEVEYRHGMTTGEWHRRLVLPNSELVVMHGPAVMVHFLHSGGADAFSAPNLFTFGKRVYRNPPKFKITDNVPEKVDHLLLLVHGAGEWRNQKEKIQSSMRPRVVRRGFDESEIEDMEPSNIDHLLLMCHGVGSACDMRFRSVEEVVDDFRATSLQLLQSHYRNSYEAGVVGRVEVLPISWHTSLHAGPRGVDRRLARVTLASIPRLRSFTNDTVLDVLFYTSPHYCQMILNTVCGELNRVYTLFKARNPQFKGGVSLGGHSLGSVILYDLLCHQDPPSPIPMRTGQKQYLSGTADQEPAMKYPKLCFEPLSLYALGSPIAIFECIRGVESLGTDFFLPTCPNFFNIFHPYDPIAYRIEPLVNPQLQNVKPSLIPHHKGRKRMHLELKETMARVGADLKQKLMESIKSTWSSMWTSTAPPPDHQLEKVVEEEIEKEQMEDENPKEEIMQSDVVTADMLGRLNNGRRVDYVLQEAPFEMINEYLFAMSSHVCYWESEDTMLLMLREIYDSLGVQADVTVPQQSMTVIRTAATRSDEKFPSPEASTSRSES